MGLKDSALELIGELRSVCEAEKHFDSRLARQALDELIELIIRTALDISACYSQSKLSELTSLEADADSDYTHSCLFKAVVCSEERRGQTAPGKASQAQG